MIPTYNCADYLRAALASVLMQDPGPQQMEIVVVDDCSTRDDPEAVVREVAANRVQFTRNHHNLGPTATFNRCIALAHGQRLHILHGDDEVRAGFYDTLGLAFRTDPAIGAAFCRVLDIDECGMWRLLGPPLVPKAGIVPEFWRESALGQKVAFPGMTMRTQAAVAVGGFDERLGHAADWELWTRMALHYPVWYEPTPLALYRVHSRSDTSALRRTAGDVQDVRRAIDIIASQLPSSERRALRRRARQTAASNALSLAWESREAASDFRAWWLQLSAAVACSPTPRILLRAVRQLLGGVLQGLKQTVSSRPGDRAVTRTSRLP